MNVKAVAARALLACTCCLVSVGVMRAAPMPPSDLRAVDHPWDNGTRIHLTWVPSPDEATLLGYVVRRKGATDAQFVRVDLIPPGTRAFTVGNLLRARPYLFSVAALAPDLTESVALASTVPVAPSMPSS